MRKRPLRRPQLHRPPLHRVAAVLVVPLTAAVLAGCAQVVHGHPNTASAGPIGSVGLVDRLRAGTAKITSNHIDLRLDVAGQSIVASGDEKISGSRMTASDLTEKIPGAGTIRVVIIGDTFYLKLPAQLNPTDKPWVKITANSKDPELAQLAQLMSQLNSSLSLDQYTLFAKAAAGITDLGADTVGGVRTEHYSFTVLVDRLPQNLPGLSALQAAGVDELPMQVWIDAQDRVVQVLESTQAAGQQSTTTVRISKYNQPVSISAPPAAQVATH